MGSVRRHLLLAGKGKADPFFFDDFERDNGPLGSPWVDDTYSISSGQAINTPALGAELLTDPGLEDNYTDGLCDTLGKIGSPTVWEETVGPANKAQGFQATASGNALYWLAQPSPTVGKWHLITCWSQTKAVGEGRVGVRQWASSGQSPMSAVVLRHDPSPSWTQRALLFRAGISNSFRPVHQWAANATYDGINIDDVSYKEITDPADLFATVDHGLLDVKITLKGNAIKGAVGIIAKLDSTSNPQNFIIAWLFRHGDLLYVVAEKCVSGVYTTILTAVSVGAWTGTTQELALRVKGTTVKVYYGGVQRGGSLTVSDAGIVSNTKHGMFLVGSSIDWLQIDKV